jgi:hypothetical protein
MKLKGYHPFQNCQVEKTTIDHLVKERGTSAKNVVPSINQYPLHCKHVDPAQDYV